MSDTYIERIVKLIAGHRLEIERLETALSVMSQLMESEPAKPKPKAMAEASGSVTIRRIAAPERAAVPKTDKTALRKRIIESLRKNGAQSSGTLIAEMFPKGSSKKEKQLIYAALNEWAKKGLVARRPTGDYELVEQASH